MKPLPTLPSDTRPIDAFVIGENSMDLVATVHRYPQPDAKCELTDFVEQPGGEGAAAAVGLARLGWRTKYAGRFGDDRWGQVGLAALEGEGVNVDDTLVIPNAATRFALVVVEAASARRTVLWRRDPALALDPDDVTDDSLGQTRVLLVGSDDVRAMVSAARRARARGVRTVGDLERIHAGTEALLRELDVLVMAPSFAHSFTGKADVGAALRIVAEQSGAALTCVTLGEEGCLALAEGDEIHVPAFRTDVVDTTGAGDLFRAGLIARWLMEPAGARPDDVLRYAAAVASLNCRSRGAWSGAPRAAEVDALLQA